LQAAIKDKYGITADLHEGVGGIFTVAIDGQLVYNNQETYRFPESEEIFREIDKVKS
jgi:predicted Rdx family selenoprotein